jgi:hypothetical protein
VRPLRSARLRTRVALLRQCDPGNALRDAWRRKALILQDGRVPLGLASLTWRAPPNSTPIARRFHAFRTAVSSHSTAALSRMTA